MPSIRFFIPGEPLAQPRPRATARMIGKRAVARVYNPSGKTRDLKDAIRQEALRVHRGGLPVHGARPSHLRIEFRMPRPKRKVWKTKPMPREPHTAKPDLDNMEKLVMDALEGVLWKNDSQVASKSSVKFICEGSESPGIFVESSEFEFGY